MATHTSAIALEETPHTNIVDSTKKIEGLTEIICGGGEESAAALFVLMGTLQDSADPQVVAHAVKHLAFTHCGELNAFGMVDAHLPVLERELLAAARSAH